MSVPLGAITKHINRQPEFNFGRISSSGCRDNRENVVIKCDFSCFFPSNIKDNSSNNQIILMQLGVITNKGINGLSEFNFSKILSSSC
jgi:hypothetical protein